MTLFGLSVTGYRNEGGTNGRGEPANQWAVWERAGAVEPATTGCELWRCPEPALDRAAACGAEVLMLGVEWARVEPRPGQVDARALEGYARILRLCAARGMAPLVVLHDVAHPEWLGEEFWLTPGSPDRFAEHVARVCGALGDLCRHWVTVRQPNLVALAGWVGGRHPPRRFGAGADAWAVLDNLLSAHVLSYEAIHGLGPGPAAGRPVVMMGLRASSVYDWGPLALDLLGARAAGVDADGVDAWVARRRAAHDAAFPPDSLAELAGRRGAAALAAYGRPRGTREPGPRRVLRLVSARRTGGPPMDALLAVWRPPRLGAAAVPDELRGLVRWAGERLGRVPPDDGDEPPGRLGAWLAHQRRTWPGLDLWVEDGYPAGGGPGVGGPPGGRDDEARARHLRGSIAEAVHAVPAGVDGPRVAGYLYHALAGVGEPTSGADYGLVPASSLRGPRGVEEGGAGADAWWSHAACEFARLVAEHAGGRG